MAGEEKKISENFRGRGKDKQRRGVLHDGQEGGKGLHVNKKVRTDQHRHCEDRNWRRGSAKGGIGGKPGGGTGNEERGKKKQSKGKANGSNALCF